MNTLSHSIQIAAEVRHFERMRTTYLLAILFLLAITPRSFAKIYLHADQDTVRFRRSSLREGIPAEAPLSITGKAPNQITVKVHLSDTVNFRVDTLYTFYSYPFTVHVEFTPQTLGYHSCVMTVTGDSNSIAIELEGFAHPYDPLEIFVGMDDPSFSSSDTRCYPFYVLSSDAPYSITDIKLIVTKGIGTPFSTSGVPTLPRIVSPAETLTWQICVDGANQNDSISGVVRVFAIDTFGYRDTLDAPFAIFVHGATATDDSCVTVIGNAYQNSVDLGIGSSYTLSLSGWLPLTSRMKDSLLIDSVSLTGVDASRFSVSSFEHGGILSTFSSDTVRIGFMGTYPYHKASYQAVFHAKVHDLTNPSHVCKPISAVLYAGQWDVAIDSSYLTIPPDTSKTLAIYSDSLRSTHYFALSNTSGADLIVKDVFFTGIDASYFHLLTTFSSNHDTLTTSGWYQFYVGIDPESSRSYDAVLNIETENALATYQYRIKTVQTRTADVKPLADDAGPQMTIVPNPADRFTTLSCAGFQDVRYTVYDLLGNVVASSRGPSSWRWDLRSGDGTQMPAGTYFGRAEGIAPNGVRAVCTKRLVIAGR